MHSVRRNRYIANALADVRDDLEQIVRECIDNVTVVIHMDDFLCQPITLRSGSGSNKVVIRIDECGSVRYECVLKTWSSNIAVHTVQSIVKNIMGFFRATERLEGSGQFVTY